MKIGHIT